MYTFELHFYYRFTKMKTKCHPKYVEIKLFTFEMIDICTVFFLMKILKRRYIIEMVSRFYVTFFAETHKFIKSIIMHTTY